MLPIISILAQCCFLIFIYMNILFLLALYKKDNSIADTGWGIGFIGITLYTFFIYSSYTQRQILATILILTWGMRLATHIYMRNKGKGEDPRYQQWRHYWGNRFIIMSYLQVFMAQGLGMLMIATPVIVINSSRESNLGFFDLLGFVIWFIGFFFETVADYQLYAFLQDPENRGRIMKKGLWQNSRHPNYFGEILIWWGMFVIACNVSYGWVTIISPLTISYLLLFVSGIPLAEKQLAGLKEFAEYEKKTSIFIPWFTHKRQ